MTSSQPARDDLIVLTADLDMKLTAETLIGHPKKLSIRTVKFHVRTHERRDPGCRTEAATYLLNFTNRYHYALVIFDRDGCGSPAPRDQIQREVEHALHRNGWPDRAKAIVIEPELEAWIWTSSPETATTLGCSSLSELRTMLEHHDLCPPGSRKPQDPKAAMKFICRQNGIRHSATLFRNIASRATSRHCQDPAFLEFRQTLQAWFPSRKLRL